ncbi:MAG TPA: cyclic nucleotide-binding domain-containing protein [Gemmatimonadaceae bacterium]|nr:cyclic nucleotide-binding domain-containing protein [Gemmatimonadaceae bacterium]
MDQQPVSLETVIGFLVATPLFDGLDADERAELVEIMEVEHYAAGEEVFHEGDAGDSWYVIFEGRAEVEKDVASGHNKIASLRAGSCFGEMAILDGHARSATVRADGPLTTFRFRRARFNELLEQGSLGAFKLVAAMARTLAQRQRQLTQHMSDLMETRATPRSIRAQIGDVVDRSQISE